MSRGLEQRRWKENMTQAITTKYFGPTNTRGSRVKAQAQAGSVTIHWDYALNSDDNHKAAAKALMAKFEWDKHSVIAGSGELPDGRGTCFIMARKQLTTRRKAITTKERRQ